MGKNGANEVCPRTGFGARLLHTVTTVYSEKVYRYPDAFPTSSLAQKKVYCMDSRWQYYCYGQTQTLKLLPT